MRTWVVAQSFYKRFVSPLAIFPMGPNQAVYTATKAGVCGFSQSAGVYIFVIYY